MKSKIVIESTVSRLWPAYGLDIRIGRNEFDSLSDFARGLIRPLQEAGLLTITEQSVAETPEPKRQASAEAEAAAVAQGRSETKISAEEAERRKAPPKKDEKPKG